MTAANELDNSTREALIKINNNKSGPSIYQRDENGLLQNINYSFNEDGSVDWRAMIKEEHLFPNKGWFESRKKTVPRTIDGLKDHQLLIKLSGIKELARLRGFTSCHYETVKCEENHVAVSCSIQFIGNYETSNHPISFEDMANATLNNTSSFATKFLETIACNRAFVRCVRNFLNVHIVGDDEIDKSDSGSVSSISKSQLNSLSPQGILENESISCGIRDFDSFKDELRNWHKNKIFIFDQTIDPGSWFDYNDIPPKHAREFLKILKSQK